MIWQMKKCIETHVWMHPQLFKLTNYQPMLRLTFRLTTVYLNKS